MLLSTPTTCASIGWATELSTACAEAPGYVALTVTCGGTMSGSCATGMRSIDSTPASVMTIAMTIASRGRRIKTAEIIGSRLGVGQRRAGRPRRHHQTGPHPLDAVQHDHLALGQATENRHRNRRRLA